MLFRRCPATIQYLYAPLSWQKSFSPTAVDQSSAFLTWKANESNFDGLLLISGDTHRDENWVMEFLVFFPMICMSMPEIAQKLSEKPINLELRKFS